MGVGGDPCTALHLAFAPGWGTQYLPQKQTRQRREKVSQLRHEGDLFVSFVSND